MSVFPRFWGRDGDDGQAVVITALLLSVLLLAIGLAMDTGRLFDARRSAQEAADAAAWGGAVVIYNSGTSAQASTAAVADAALNAFTTGGTTTVSVSAPPSSGAFAGNANYVEVVITRQVPTTFIPTGGGMWTIRVRGVAGAAPTQTGAAILSLDRTASGAVSTVGNGSIVASGGDIQVNSTSLTAAMTTGNATIGAPGQAIRVVGGTSGSGFNPAPLAGSPARPDPYAAYPLPDISGLTVQACCPDPLLPGIYDGGISLAGNQQRTMLPGMYVLRGGGISLTGNSSLTGDGVFIFNTSSTYPASGGACADVKIAGNGSSVLSAMTSGTYAKLLIFQDPSCTSGVELKGNGSGVATTGAIYVPNGEVRSVGNGNLTVHSQIVAARVRTVGNGSLTVNYVAGENPQPIVPALSE